MEWSDLCHEAASFTVADSAPALLILLPSSLPSTIYLYRLLVAFLIHLSLPPLNNGLSEVRTLEVYVKKPGLGNGRHVSSNPFDPIGC